MLCSQDLIAVSMTASDKFGANNAGRSVFPLPVRILEGVRSPKQPQKEGISDIYIV